MLPRGLKPAPKRPPNRPQKASLKILTHNQGTVAGWAEGHSVNGAASPRMTHEVHPMLSSPHDPAR
eukprot:8503855-Pyramimonas_sp.AAC.1